MTTRPHAIGPFFGLFLLAACSCNDEVQSANGDTLSDAAASDAKDAEPPDARCG